MFVASAMAGRGVKNRKGRSREERGKDEKRDHARAPVWYLHSTEHEWRQFSSCEPPFSTRPPFAIRITPQRLNPWLEETCTRPSGRDRQQRRQISANQATHARVDYRQPTDDCHSGCLYLPWDTEQYLFRVISHPLFAHTLLPANTIYHFRGLISLQASTSSNKFVPFISLLFRSFQLQ